MGESAGSHETVYNSIMKCDVDIRKDLYANSYCQEEPLCTQVLLTECKRKLLDLLHQPSRLRSLLHQRGNTLYGLEDPSLLHSPPSSLCGYPSRNMMSLVQELFTANAFKP